MQPYNFRCFEKQTTTRIRTKTVKKVTIPDTVSHNNTTYKVTSIADKAQIKADKKLLKKAGIKTANVEKKY